VRRLFSISFVFVLLLVFVPAVGAHESTRSDSTRLDVSVAKAGVAPDGTTAGEITDIVVTFVDPDPAVEGISLKKGGTVSVTLPHGFEFVGGGGGNSIALLQGWPQSPPAPPPLFPWTTAVSGQTVTATLTADYLVGGAGPGPKQIHLLLNEFRNPEHPGRYRLRVTIQPDPSSDATYRGTGTVRIIPKARPSINVVSVFSGGGPPPPFNNPIYQTVTPGDSGNDVGLYLWDKGSSVADGVINPLLGVDLVMTNARHGRLVMGDKTVGHVRIRAPHRADEFALTTGGPSTLGTTAVTGLDAGVLIVTFTTDPDVTGDYTIMLRMNNGNRQKLYVTAE